ncbi:hypothetical protein [Paucibacter sp. XJ19-41]|uniref:hypothetical protein n=1 Tax=Paucibacter sp. XJ19-41 TaxID=2927824 RepID=UPI00234B8082|nr:hypothetical protein [Paucibacter sp. XJ19-41]MDC6168697.1 hypothetical protein [Paucibacter sp. XJ19-41]
MQVSFSLPAHAVHRTLLRYRLRLASLGALFLLPGVLKEGAVGAFDLLACIGTALLLYIVARVFTWVTISAEGIEGAMRPSGDRTKLGWQDKLVVRRTSYFGLQCIDLVTLDGGQSIRVPTEITRSAAFQRAVSHVAPPGHPLRRLSTAAA